MFQDYLLIKKSKYSKSFFSKEGILPTLQLETKDGAILVNEDPLSIVFLSPTQPEEVQSTVLSWNLPPLPERYLEACNILKIGKYIFNVKRLLLHSNYKLYFAPVISATNVKFIDFLINLFRTMIYI